MTPADDTDKPAGAAPDGGRLTTEAERAAADAARAANVPMNAWIAQAIRKAAVPPPAAGPAASSAGAMPNVADLARRVPIGALSPGRFQTRDRITAEEIEELAQSIRARGILQPILVRQRPGALESYEILAGERRWRAAQASGLTEVPVVVLSLNDHDAMEAALVENMQRQDLTPLEEAEGYRRLIEDFAHTQEDAARLAGKSRSHIANTLRLINLPDAVKELLNDGRLSAGHGRALINAPNPAAVAQAVVARGLNVRQTEEMVQRAHRDGTAKAVKSTKDADILALEKEFSELLGMKCTVNYRNDRGSLNIRFKDLSSLGQLIAKLQRIR